ncbi:MAG: thiamine diphosphokinase [Parabacteroides sp.]
MNMPFDYDCIVMANGAFPEREVLWDLVRQARCLIACDGASDRLIRRGIVPTAIVGDLDSIPEETRRQYADRIYPVIDQEINDLTKSVRHAASLKERNVLILGATGLREDHTLGNISLLMDYAPLFDRIEMATDYGWFTPLLHSATLSSQPGQQISIFSLCPTARITSQGLRWSIQDRCLTAWWQGTLNEALSDRFTLTLSEGAKVLVFRNYLA